MQGGPEPKSKLGYYRLLSPTAAVRVSPLCVGGMTFGTTMKQVMGEIDKKTVFEMLDYYYEHGGNFIDTAVNYHNGESEQWIGEWMQKRNNRDEMVISTKFSQPYTLHKNKNGINVNYAGNSKKNLKLSVQESLKNLQTDYIDILYVHIWDYTTSIPELMQSLNDLVRSGKVLYLGISDTPAWVVSKANQYARDFGLTQFSVYQGRWSIYDRDFEREIIPMAKSEGMALCPFRVLGGGRFKTEEEKKSGEGRNIQAMEKFFPTNQETMKRVIDTLEKLAKAKGSTITGIALSYVMQKMPYVFPIIGVRKLEHLKSNIEALEKVRLSPEDIKELEAANPIELGFPHDMLGGTSSQNNMMLKLAGILVEPTEPQAIVHAP